MSTNWWRSERQRLENRVNRLIERARVAEDDELRGELARYICILMASLIDKRCGECAVRFVARRSEPLVANFVAGRLHRIPKTTCRAIRDLFKELDADRAEAWYNDLPDEERDAVDSIRNNRNQLAHGGYVGLSLGQLTSYKDRADKALAALFLQF